MNLFPGPHAAPREAEAAQPWPGHPQVLPSPQCCALSSSHPATAQVSVLSTEVDPEHRQGPVAHSADQVESRIYFPFVHPSILIKYFFKKAAVLEMVPF